MRPLAVLSAGIQCSVGLQGPAAYAAIRCGIGGAVETDFVDLSGKPILGCPVLLDKPYRGIEKLVRLAAPPIAECLQMTAGTKADQIALLLGVAETGRPGRLPGLEEALLPQIQHLLGKRFHPESRILATGRVGIAHALRQAEGLIHEKKVPYCILAGVDSLIHGVTLRVLETRDRILTGRNSNGFIPGEAASAVLVGALQGRKGPQLACRGLGFGREAATIESEAPLRADGLLEAFRECLKDAKATTDDVDYRIADLNGEQYSFKESALMVSRAVRKVKPRFEIWHPADCIGEVGAAAGGCMVGVALTAARKGYAPGPGVVCQLAADGGERAAVLLTYGEQAA